MKTHFYLQKIIASLLGLFLFSCSLEETLDESDNVLMSTLSEQSVCFNIKYDVSDGYRVLFDVYAENPFVITSEGVYKKEIQPIISGMTDENGCYNVSRTVSKGVKEVYVLSRSVGTPNLLYGVIGAGQVHPVEYSLSGSVEEHLSSRGYSPWLLGRWNSWGCPNYIDDSKTSEITKNELRTISKALPEWKKVNDIYTVADYIYVKEEAEVWISLLSAKSLFNSSLGYYCYNEGMPKNEVLEVIAFPRADLSILDTRGLKPNEYIKLKYHNPKTGKMEDKFPAGTRIGWVLHRSGFCNWSNTINMGTYQFYSNSDWNPERTNKEHTAIFSTSEGHVILGFEDSYNDAIWADNDCNDLVFHVASSPIDAIATSVEASDASVDFIEEEVDVVQPLSMIIDVPSSDKLADDLIVASKSTLNIENEMVVGVKDVFYIAKSEAMNDFLSTTYTASDMARKVVVRTTVKFALARSSEEKEKKKGRTVVRTTVKNTTWDVDNLARATNMYSGTSSEVLWEVIEANRDFLQCGECIRVEVVMQFEGVPYDEFIESINVPPYSPFIEKINE